MNRNLIVIGASGHGKVIADVALLTGYGSVEFYDDNYLVCRDSFPYPVVGAIDHLVHGKRRDSPVFIAIGDNTVRASLFSKLKMKEFRFATLLHPSAIISPNALIGSGSVVMAGAVINSCSLVGDGCVINTACSVDHDCNIGSFSHISPGVNLAGNVQVGRNSWVGIGSTVIQNIVIGDYVQLGASSTVVCDIIEPGLYVGAPAKRVR